MWRAGVARVLLFVFAAAVAAQDATPPKPAEAVPVEPADMDWKQLGEALAPAMERLTALQEADGSWPKPAAGSDLMREDVGRWALASHALYRSLNFTAGPETPKAHAASEKGLAFIVQRKAQAQADSAAVIVEMLWRRHARGYRERIDVYAPLLLQAQAVDGPQAGAFVQPGRSAVGSTFFASIGLATATRAGVQVPKAAWEKARAFLVATQHADGGWGVDGSARDAASTPLETFEGAAALYVVEDALQPAVWDEDSHPESAELLRALDCAGKSVRGVHSPYGWYVLAQLARVTKRFDLGGVDWRRLCVNELLPRLRDGKLDGTDDIALAILAVVQDHGEVVIGKVRRAGDWETRRNDVRGLIEYISDKFSYPKDWRVVTLDADVDALLGVPILWMNGRKPLAFTDAEKAKLKAYVAGGGTIWAEATGGSMVFERSFRALAAELWPEAKLETLPREHVVLDSPRRLRGPMPEMLALRLAAQRDRVAVAYFPRGGMGSAWARIYGGAAPGTSKGAVDLATNLYFYANKIRNRGPIEAKEPVTPGPE